MGSSTTFYLISLLLGRGGIEPFIASRKLGIGAQLPHDLITGEPYKYRPTDDGQFLLYSVGSHEKDDGGKPGKTLFDEKDGDWVWQYVRN